jgi:membrane-associated HD superfamily phosphohydrolase
MYIQHIIFALSFGNETKTINKKYKQQKIKVMETVKNLLGQMSVISFIVASVLIFLFSLHTPFMFAIVGLTVRIMFFIFMLFCVVVGMYIFDNEYTENKYDI